MRKTVFLLIAGGVACASHRPATSTTTPSTPASRTAAADTTRSTAPMRGGSSTPLADPFPSTYRPFASRPTLIRNATILTAAGPTIRNGSVLLRDGPRPTTRSRRAEPRSRQSLVWRRIGRCRDSEIEKLDLMRFGIIHHVVRLQIAMDNAGRMSGLHRIANLDYDTGDLFAG